MIIKKLKKLNRTYGCSKKYRNKESLTESPICTGDLVKASLVSTLNRAVINYISFLTL